MRRLLTFGIAGVIAQLVDGALGMAYGVTATTLLLSTGATAAAASASVHLAEVGTTLASGVSHWRFGNVSWRTVRWLALPGAAGAFAGAYVLSSVDSTRMRPVVAGLLLALGLFIVARFAFGVVRSPVTDHHLQGRFLAPLGVVAGFVDAIGGGGWGPLTTPTLMTAGRMEPRRAVGSASASEFLVASAASTGFLVALDRSGVDLGLALMLLGGGVLAAPIAAWLVHRLDPRVAGTLVGSAVVLTNTRTLLLAADASAQVRLPIVGALGLAAAALVIKAARRSRAERRAAAPAADGEEPAFGSW